MNEDLREMLYRAYDSELSSTERAELERALAEWPELRAEQQQIERLREALGQSAAVGFSIGFTKRVLEQIQSPPCGGLSNAALVLFSMQRWFRWVAAVGVAGCAILLVLNLKMPAAEGVLASDLVGETPVESMLEDSP